MESGTAAVLGAIVGSFASPVTTLFADFLRHRRTDRTHNIRRRRLEKILSLPDRKFVSLPYLARAIAADEKSTARLLLEVGARPSQGTASNKWVLISRCPFPEDAATEIDKEEGEEDAPLNEGIAQMRPDIAV